MALKFAKKLRKKDIILKKHIPIRMCIVCKNRFEQDTLFRFRFVLEGISTKEKRGRSSYLCENCIKKDEKILQKAFSKVCKNHKINQQELKEKILNGKD